MTTGYDMGGLVEGLGPVCGGCGQPLNPPGNHLAVCPLIPSSAIPEQTVEAVEDMEHKLGEAV